jgi:large subunit ribosomal protein L6
MQKYTLFHRIISLPPGIKAQLLEKLILLHGPMGEMTLHASGYDPKSQMAFKLVQDNPKDPCALHVIAPSKHMLKGFCTLFSSYIEALSQGVALYLTAIGVGYKMLLDNDVITFRVGLGHTVSCAIPPDIKLFSTKPTELLVYGVDKQRVTQVMAQLRAIKVPEPYKGKGIRRKMESVLRKEGKKK